MEKKLSVTHKGREVYMLSATLIADGKKTMRVMYQGRMYFWPKVNVEMTAPGTFAMTIEQYDILFNQDLFKKTTMVKATFRRNGQKVPKPRLRISKN